MNRYQTFFDADGEREQVAAFRAKIRRNRASVDWVNVACAFWCVGVTAIVALYALGVIA